MSTPPWRRLADWKREVTLVHRGDLDAPLLARLGLVDPVERVDPALAAALEASGWLRAGPVAARALRQAGVPTWTVGYHRGSDGLLVAEDGPGGHAERQVEAAALADEHDDLDDVVDALVRILSEGALSEAAVLLAAAAPALGEDADVEPGGDPADLPAASDALVDAVAARLAAYRPPRPGSDLSPAQRRAYQRQAALLGAVGLALVGAGLAFAPMLAALASPLVVLAAVILLLHEVALRQG